MTKKTPPFYPVIICWSFAALDWQLWAAEYIAAKIILFVLLIGGIAYGVDWLMYEAAKRWQDFEAVKYAGELTVLDRRMAYLAMYKSLTDEQLDAIGKTVPAVGVIPTTGSKVVKFVELYGRKIYFDFIELFLRTGDNNDPDYLAAVTTWSPKSNKRLDSEAFTRYCVEGGFANPARDQDYTHPAKWGDRVGALKSIDYVEE
jgi:hypothetical protein